MKKAPNDKINSDHVDWFRASAPYIHTHRGSTFVILFGGESVDHPGFAHLINDIALLGSLGVRLVLVHGARPQIEKQLQHLGLESSFADELRITTAENMPGVEQAVGQVRMAIEAQLSRGLPNTPMAGAAIRVVSGNFITAQPYGVRNGIDFCQTGNVRRVDAEAIASQLEQKNVVLISPIGYSLTGETFNLRAEDIATETAIALEADKLIFIMENNGVTDKDGQLLQQLDINQAEQWQKNHGKKNKQSNDENRLTQALLNKAAHACRSGVNRTHMISQNIDGALLLELYSRDGVGTLVSADNYEGLRTATIDDIGGIMELIAPLEEKGVLVKRSREQLELDIKYFTVIERDSMIIGCAALFLFPEEKAAELACLAVHPDYQQQGRGNDLMEHIEWQARKQHITELFTLTTQTTHWFLERGFSEVPVEKLPMQKQSLYNYQRKSKILYHALS
ncbi:MAG: amino-acid N-acetyltransferase [Gammaproteobacteria bacterium]|nr:amino-acid N-acetyltransferase [Gammaproteobacteria bacterium]